VERRVHDEPGGSVTEVVGLLPGGSEDAVDPLPAGVDVAEYLVQAAHREGVNPHYLVDVSSRGLGGEGRDEGGEEGRLAHSRWPWGLAAIITLCYVLLLRSFIISVGAASGAEFLFKCQFY